MPPFQIDNPALLANKLVNATDKADDIQIVDLSLILELLNTVIESPEDLQKEEVSG